MMAFLVTGASGFLGKHLTKSLVAQGHNIKALVRKVPTYYFSKGVINVLGDLLDSSSLVHATEGIDIIVHAAAVINSTKKEDFEKVNVYGTQNIVNAAKTNSVQKIIYISTYDVVLNPKGMYGGSKLKAEQIIKESGVPYVILRPNTIYGPGERQGITELIKLVRKSYVVPMVGSGRAMLQPIHVSDVCKAVLASANPSIKNDIFEIGGPDTLTFKQLIELIAKELGVKRITVPIPVSLLVAGSWFYNRLAHQPWNKDKLLNLTKDKSMNITRMRNEFGIQPIGVKEGIKELVKIT